MPEHSSHQAGYLALLPEGLFPALLEQLMRCTDDETLLLALVSKSSSLESLRSALGEFLPALAVPLHAGTPVLVALGYGPLDPDWRLAVPPLPVSLWSELEFLRTLERTTSAPDPLTELLSARV